MIEGYPILGKSPYSFQHLPETKFGNDYKSLINCWFDHQPGGTAGSTRSVRSGVCGSLGLEKQAEEK